VVHEGDLIGMVSDRDIASFARGLDVFAPSALEAALDRPMEDFMQGDVLSVDEDTDVAEVIDTMIDQRIGALPVVDAHSGRLCGIVSYVDILKVARGVL
jgi:CBS domain-containing protein